MKLGFVDIMISLAFSLVAILGLSTKASRRSDTIQLVLLQVDCGRPIDWQNVGGNENVVIDYRLAGVTNSVTIAKQPPARIQLSPNRAIDDLVLDLELWDTHGVVGLVGQAHPEAEITVTVTRSWSLTSEQSRLLTAYEGAVSERKGDKYHEALLSGVGVLNGTVDVGTWRAQIPEVGAILSDQAWRRDVAESLFRENEKSFYYRYPRKGLIYLLSEISKREASGLSSEVSTSFKSLVDSDSLIGHRFLASRYPLPVPFDESLASQTLKLSPKKLEDCDFSSSLFVLETFVLDWICPPIRARGTVSGKPVAYSTVASINPESQRIHSHYQVTTGQDDTKRIESEISMRWSAGQGFVE